MLNQPFVQIPIKPSFRNDMRPSILLMMKCARGSVSVPSYAGGNKLNEDKTRGIDGELNCMVEISLKGGPAQHIPSTSKAFDGL